MDLPINYKNTHYSVRKIAREEYQVIQKNHCWFCGAKLDEIPDSQVQNCSINKKLFPKGFFNHPVHLHHDHNTDMTIGAVHARCNAYLWQYKRQ